ncbi:MAG: alpha/beta hydrolase [Methanomassiliicoccales archaeon]
MQSKLPPLWEIPLETARMYRPEMDSFFGLKREEMRKVEDKKIQGRDGNEILLRTYEPHTQRKELGTVLYYHGGGFVIGNVESYDALCRTIAKACDCRVISVDYRLAPEHKFPAAQHDAIDAFMWSYDNVRPQNFAVMGDSAGGNLAAVTALAARDAGKRIRLQILIYPTLMACGLVPSYFENGDAPVLNMKTVRWFRDQFYSSVTDLQGKLASPLLIDDLKGLPDALIVTAELDPLRDHGEMYAERLREAGVSVTGIRYSGMVHGFFNMMFSKSARSVLATSAALLRGAFYNE